MYLWRCRTLGILIMVLCSSVLGNDVGTGGQVGIVRTLSSYTLGRTGLHCGGAFKYGTERDYLAGPDGVGSVLALGKNGVTKTVTRNNPTLLSGDIFAAYGIWDNLDLSVDLPVYSDNTGWGESMAGVGDLEVALKFGYPFQKDNAFFTHAYYLKVIFPTGNPSEGYFPRHSYFLMQNQGTSAFSTDAMLFNPIIAWTMDFEKLSKKVQLQLHVNLGGAIPQKKSSSAVIAAVGLCYTPLPLLTVFTELSGESRVKYYSEYFDAASMNNDVLLLTPGVRFNIPKGFYATVAADLGLSDSKAAMKTNWLRNKYEYSTKGVPRYGVQLALGWNGVIKEKDSDGDGIIDKVDKCPYEAEDLDGFQDEDGCPDIDNDGDGVVDLQDKCPDVAGKVEGCPVYDADNDGVLDENDKCPQEAEDMDGFQDEDGCPDLDNDNDGIPDVNDKCPLKAEDIDGFEDADGCPDLDNDGDGVFDADDKCPNVSGVPENNGCPKTEEIKRGKLVLAGVTFQPGKDVLTSNSFTILDQVYESLADWPEVKLEIQGHTDNIGNNMTNLKLSQMRADAVKLYLIQKGIRSDRLRSVGYGEEFPLADNKSPEGREKNRRVELRRID